MGQNQGSHPAQPAASNGQQYNSQPYGQQQQFQSGNAVFNPSGNFNQRFQIQASGVPSSFMIHFII